MIPLRIQRKRSKGFRLPGNTVVVDRSSRYGNPFNDTQAGIVFLHNGASPERPAPILHLRGTLGRARCLDLHLAYLRGRLAENARFLEPLRGQNLACWCQLCAAHHDGKPLGVDCEHCHADHLLRLSNA